MEAIGLIRESRLIQDFVYELLVLDGPVFRLALLQHLLDLFLTHRHPVAAQVEPHLAGWDAADAVGVEHPEALEQFLLHGHFGLLIDLTR